MMCYVLLVDFIPGRSKGIKNFLLKKYQGGTVDIINYLDKAKLFFAQLKEKPDIVICIETVQISRDGVDWLQTLRESNGQNVILAVSDNSEIPNNLPWFNISYDSFDKSKLKKIMKEMVKV